MSLHKRQCWGILVRSRNRLDGYREHLLYHNCKPRLFSTRSLARGEARYLNDNLRCRPYLMAEPHGWLPRKVIKVVEIIDYA